MAKHIFIPTTCADDWKQFLAEPDRQWHMGYSARTLASCWESTAGFPREVTMVFTQSGVAAFENLQLLMAFPEYPVDLPGGRRPSQNDLLVLAKDGDGELVTVAVEGKISEPFGETLADWNATTSTGKRERLVFLENLLGQEGFPGHIRYQLLHRSASAILEARKFNAKSAVMLVHSFSPEMLWLEDYQAFVRLFGVDTKAGELCFLRKLSGIDFYAAWVKGDPKFRAE